MNLNLTWNHRGSPRVLQRGRRASTRGSLALTYPTSEFRFLVRYSAQPWHSETWLDSDIYEPRTPGRCPPTHGLKIQALPCAPAAGLPAAPPCTGAGVSKRLRSRSAGNCLLDLRAFCLQVAEMAGVSGVSCNFRSLMQVEHACAAASASSLPGSSVCC